MRKAKKHQKTYIVFVCLNWGVMKCILSVFFLGFCTLRHRIQSQQQQKIKTDKRIHFGEQVR